MSTPNQGLKLKALQENGCSVLLASNMSHKDHCPLSILSEGMTGFSLSFCLHILTAQFYLVLQIHAYL